MHGKIGPIKFDDISTLNKHNETSVSAVASNGGVMPLPDLTEEEEKKFRAIGKKKISELTGQEWDEYNSFNIRILKALQKQCEGEA